jgi:putative hemolysin
VLPFLLLFGEIIPKVVGLKHAEKLIPLNARPLLWFSNLTIPIRNALVWLPEKILWMIGARGGWNKSVSEGLFRSMVDVGTEEGVLNAQEQKLIHNVFTLDDVKVGSIMTPKERVVSLSKEMTVAEVMKKVETERYSRYPVVAGGYKAIVGVLYVKDLLAAEPIQQTDGIHFFLRTPLIVRPDRTALELFSQFRSRRTHFAIVADPEHQEMMGVVTLDDILEEVFGHLRDERDEEEAPSKSSS